MSFVVMMFGVVGVDALRIMTNSLTIVYIRVGLMVVMLGGVDDNAYGGECCSVGGGGGDECVVGDMNGDR